MSALYIVIPISILIVILLVAGVLLLMPDEQTVNPKHVAESKPTISVNPKKELTVYRNPLTKWIELAWENTWTEIIKRYYWEADRKVREFLQRMGWE